MSREHAEHERDAGQQRRDLAPARSGSRAGRPRRRPCPARWPAPAPTAAGASSTSGAGNQPGGSPGADEHGRPCDAITTVQARTAHRSRQLPADEQHQEAGRQEHPAERRRPERTGVEAQDGAERQRLGRRSDDSPTNARQPTASAGEAPRQLEHDGDDGAGQRHAEQPAARPGPRRRAGRRATKANAMATMTTTANGHDHGGQRGHEPEQQRRAGSPVGRPRPGRRRRRPDAERGQARGPERAG